MEDIILEILNRLRAGETVDDRELVRITHATLRRAAEAGRPQSKRAFAKRLLLSFYQRIKREEPERWQAWGATPELERQLLQVLRMKPRRTASGVATITVITKPWPCSGNCRFCPNDIRMPKSYLHGEPACERAEQNYFDPYLQVSARLTALSQMGHATDKVELIILGGTWSDYPEGYQIWFARELFRALNDGAISSVSANPQLQLGEDKDEPGPSSGALEASNDALEVSRDLSGVLKNGSAEGTDAGDAAVDVEDAAADVGGAVVDAEDAAACGGLFPEVARRRAFYVDAGFLAGDAQLEQAVSAVQHQVNTGTLTYNQAFRAHYAQSDAWDRAAAMQTATFAELEREQRANESARHRVVGLVIETRPDAVTAASLTTIRRLGATKVQMGVQSLDQRILDSNDRGIDVDRIAESFNLLRAFGFKIHAHAMANLLGATPASDKRDYRRLVREKAFQPDEVKLYPCALIEGARLCGNYEDGTWRPYSEDELLDVLADDVLATPPFCRISRMIRDFSSNDILVGNKKPNLRQLVEQRLREHGGSASAVDEIRYREVGTGEVDVSKLRMETVPYETTNTSERFLQWVAPDGRIAGFLRLSLPHEAYVRAHAGELPVHVGEAMIREVHVYGAAARLGEEGRAAQHLGLGRKLVERACELAARAGYTRINVISAVGTRGYYRMLGFYDAGLYQQKELADEVLVGSFAKSTIQ